MLEKTRALPIDPAKEAKHVEACLQEIKVNEGKIVKDETAFMILLQVLADLSYVVRVVHHILEGKIQHLLDFLFALRNALLCEIEEQGFAIHLILREELQNPNNGLLNYD